jgi:hypothetical protein
VFVNRLQFIPPVTEVHEYPGNCRMFDRPILFVGHQILLTDISNIAVVRIFREQMIERLILARSNLGWNRIVPFLAIGKDRIDIEDHTAKFKHSVAHHIADAKTRARNRRRSNRARAVQSVEYMRHDRGGKAEWA